MSAKKRKPGLLDSGILFQLQVHLSKDKRLVELFEARAKAPECKNAHLREEIIRQLRDHQLNNECLVHLATCEYCTINLQFHERRKLRLSTWDTSVRKSKKRRPVYA